MRVSGLHCTHCFLNNPETADRFDILVLPKNDCIYQFECPLGHHFSVNIVYYEFQKLFESAVNALAINQYREAVSSFSASYERFIELFIRITMKANMKANGISIDAYSKAWKQISNQSERQIGAFVVLFVLEFGIDPPLLARKCTELRNKVIHKGYFPTEQECFEYGNSVLELIRKMIHLLYNSQKHNYELIASLNDQMDFDSSTRPNFTYYGRGTIAASSNPDGDTKTLEEMLEYAKLVPSIYSSLTPDSSGIYRLKY
jgi:hypothetical protein